MEKIWFILYTFESDGVTKVKHGLLTGLNPRIELKRLIEDVSKKECISPEQIVVLSMNII